MLDPEKSDDNELLAQMLEITERLTAYAYCWNVSENTKFELSSLVRILDGSKLYTYSTSLYSNLKT